MTHPRTIDPEAATTRSVSLPTEMAERIDALAKASPQRNRSLFLRELLVNGLVARYGRRWDVMADALKKEEIA